MKLIIMSQTMPLLVKAQEEVKTNYLNKGFIAKEVDKIQYLIKEL